MVRKSLPKIVVILGPTATGKSALAVKLAKNFNGQIVSADSRQVYRGLDLGTGKITKKQMQGIPHHLLDVVSQGRRFSVAQYQKLAYQAIDKILKKGKVPFLVGGSPLYLYSVIDGWRFPALKPDWRLRQKLSLKTAAELFAILKKLDPGRAKTIEAKNKRRLIRAIEIARRLGRVPKLKKTKKYYCLILGLNLPQEKLKQKIRARLLARLKKGLVKEVIGLKKQGLSWPKLESFGLEYYRVAQFLQNRIGYPGMISKLEQDTWNFVRRQMRWFGKDRRIHWIDNYRQVTHLIQRFLSNNPLTSSEVNARL